jgi:Fe-S-cluster containining protein
MVPPTALPLSNFSKKELKDNPCAGCDLCCRYVCMEIDTPEDKADYENIRWYVVHKNVWVFIDHDDSWNIQFNTPCEKLVDRRCSIYAKRPQVCRDYSTDACERYGEGDSFKVLWKHMEEFDEWLAKNVKYYKDKKGL